jgi:hypothetical protein
MLPNASAACTSSTGEKRERTEPWQGDKRLGKGSNANGQLSHQIGEACVARARLQLLVALADVAALSSIMIQETGPACRLWELEAFAFRWWTTHGVEESPKSCEAVQSNP